MDKRKEILKIIAETGHVSPETLQTDALLSDVGVDSLGIIEIIFSIEEKFNIEVPYNANTSVAGEGLKTVDDILEYLINLIEVQADRVMATEPLSDQSSST